MISMINDRSLYYRLNIHIQTENLRRPIQDWSHIVFFYSFSGHSSTRGTLTFSLIQTMSPMSEHVSTLFLALARN